MRTAGEEQDRARELREQTRATEHLEAIRGSAERLADVQVAEYARTRMLTATQHDDLDTWKRILNEAEDRLLDREGQ